MKLPSTSKPARPAVPRNGSIDTATIQLLAAWKQQDATTDPEQVRAAVNSRPNLPGDVEGICRYFVQERGGRERGCSPV